MRKDITHRYVLLKPARTYLLVVSPLAIVLVSILVRECSSAMFHLQQYQRGMREKTNESLSISAQSHLIQYAHFPSTRLCRSSHHRDSSTFLLHVASLSPTLHRTCHPLRARIRHSRAIDEMRKWVSAHLFIISREYLLSIQPTSLINVTV